MDSGPRRLTQLGFHGLKVGEVSKPAGISPKANTSTKESNKLKKDNNPRDRTGNATPTKSKSSDIPLEVRAESPWNYYEKSPITFLDLSGEVIIAQEKTSPKKLVGLRKMSKATLTNLQKLRHTNIYFALEAFVANKSTYVVFEEIHLTLEHLVISLAYPSSRQLGTILGQKCDPGDGAIRVADPSRWGDHTQAVIQFVSDIPLATSTRELRKQDFINSIWEEHNGWKVDILWDLIVTAQYTARRYYDFKDPA
ncbi:hypothetical protein AUP68_09140 [Ilyonectria robusta]